MALTSNYTESTRSLNNGFVLSEQELRRTLEVINEQFEKKGNPNPTIKFSVKHLNGMVAETFNVEDILKIENIGSQQIISLVLTAYSASEDNITISFANKYSQKVDEDYSVKYKVRGLERDWVMISSSLIEDRLNKITYKNYFTYLSRTKFLGAISTLLFILMVTVINTLDNDKSKNKTEQIILNYEKIYNNKGSIDIPKMLIEIEKSKLPKVKTEPVTLKYILWGVMGSMLLLSFYDLLRRMYFKYFPTCVFYWSDFIDKYDKMKKNRNLVLGFIFITLFLSIFVNLFSNYLWEKIIK